MYQVVHSATVVVVLVPVVVLTLVVVHVVVLLSLSIAHIITTAITDTTRATPITTTFMVTTARALPALQRAKTNGLDITAGTSIHHLTLNELDVADYRTFFKVKPPLRSEEDRHAIIEALQSGLIDTISSMHTPQDEESKRLPFEEAASGAVGLETLLPAALRLFHSGEMDLPGLFRALALNPAKRLGLPCGRLAIGAPADLVLFDANQPFVLDRATLKSKSKNTPFDGARLQGRVLASLVAGKQVFGQ